VDQVLVLCSNGRNRSVAIILAWLMQDQGLTLQKALDHLNGACQVSATRHHKQHRLFTSNHRSC
jgi:protein-tyrosine phosphatase